MTRTSNFTSITHDSVTFNGWLVLNANGKMTLSRPAPALNPGERAVNISVKVPKALFKLPQIKATIELPAGAQVGEIDAKTVTALEHAVKAGLGMDVTISIGGEG